MNRTNDVNDVVKDVNECEVDSTAGSEEQNGE